MTNMDIITCFFLIRRMYWIQRFHHFEVGTLLSQVPQALIVLYERMAAWVPLLFDIADVWSIYMYTVLDTGRNYWIEPL